MARAFGHPLQAVQPTATAGRRIGGGFSPDLYVTYFCPVGRRWHPDQRSERRGASMGARWDRLGFSWGMLPAFFRKTSPIFLVGCIERRGGDLLRQNRATGRHQAGRL